MRTTTAPRPPPHESPWVVTVPLILLAIPSIYAGWAYIEPMLFGGYFGRRSSSHRSTTCSRSWPRSSTAPRHGDCTRSSRCRSGSRSPASSAAWYLYMKRPDSAGASRGKFGIVHRCSSSKYGFDELQRGSSPAARGGRHRPVEGRGRRRHRRLHRERHRARSAGSRGRARVPDRLHLPLRVHDDHRPVRAAHAWFARLTP